LNIERVNFAGVAYVTLDIGEVSDAALRVIMHHGANAVSSAHGSFNHMAADKSRRTGYEYSHIKRN
jgi:hypothetical protein